MTDKTDSKEREALRNIGEEQAFEAWFKVDCPVEGANAKIAAKAAWKARASLAASAGSEPVARVNDDGFIVEIGDLLIAPGQKLYLHPSPTEGMVGGWMPIETAPKYTEHGVSQHLLLGYAPDEIHEDGFVSQGYWMEADEDAPDNMGHDGGWVDVHFDFFRCGRSFGAEAYRSAGTQPTHWMPLPPPPTTSADSRTGE